MSVQWAGNMRGSQAAVLKVVSLLLLLLSGPTRTVRGQYGEAEPEAEVLDEDAAEVAEDVAAPPPDEETEPAEEDLDATPAPPVTDVPDPDYGTNAEVYTGSGGSIDPEAEPTGSSTEETGPTASPDEELGLLLIAIPVALVILIVAIAVCGVFIHRRITSENRHSEMGKEDPFLEASSTEKVPMPMFEEDVPSVLELEMDQLDDWMKKDGETRNLNQQL